MHELGVVFYIVRDVKETAEQNNVNKVASVTITLGEVSGVIPEYLEDCWNWAAAKEPIMAGAKLICEIDEAVTYCENCGTRYPTVKYEKICPNCHSDRTYLEKGNQLSIKEIEVY